jgi:hypothetical protein
VVENPVLVVHHVEAGILVIPEDVPVFLADRTIRLSKRRPVLCDCDDLVELVYELSPGRTERVDTLNLRKPV